MALCDGRLEAVTIKMATIELAGCEIQDKVVKATPSLCRIPDKVVEATPSVSSHGRVHLSTDSGYECDGYARRHANHQLSSIYQLPACQHELDLGDQDVGADAGYQGVLPDGGSAAIPAALEVLDGGLVFLVQRRLGGGGRNSAEV